ncbi:MAG: hypothetical protein AB1607_16600 [Chloroflexota bacterium]
MKKVKDQTLITYSVNRPVEMPFWNEIVCGDSEVLLKSIPANSIDLIITSLT